MTEKNNTTVAVRKPAQTIGAVEESADLWETAQRLFQSKIAPKSIKSAKSLLYVLMMGQDMGWTATQSLSNITVINDKPSVYADGLTAILHRAGHKLEEKFEGSVEGGDYKVTCTITRKDTGSVITRTFSVDMAKRAGLWETEPMVTRRKKREHGGGTYETANDSPWYKYPERMIWRRAISWAVRDACSDEMNGLQVVEEMEDHAMTIRLDALDAEAPSRLEQKLAKHNAPETPIESDEDEVSEDIEDAVIVDSASGDVEESEKKLVLSGNPLNFDEDLAAFIDFYGTTEPGLKPEEPEVIYFRKVTYRVYRDVIINPDPDLPDGKQERPALNDEGVFCVFTGDVLNKIAPLDKENSPGDVASHKADVEEKKAATEDDTPSVAATKKKTKPKTKRKAKKNDTPLLTPDAKDWIEFINEDGVPAEDLLTQWEREKVTAWYEKLTEPQRRHLTKLFNERIEALHNQRRAEESG